MRVLVTGGLGYLGAHVAERLAGAGHEVRILGRSARPEADEWLKRFEFLPADVADAAAVADACEGMDAVVHTAALNAAASDADDRAALEVNGWGTRNVLESARRHEVMRFVYLSTFHVYGPAAAQSPLDESVAPAPVTDYALTHLLGEAYCRRYSARHGVPCVVLRLSNGYGAPVFPFCDCWTLAANDFCRQAVLGGEIVLATAGDAARDFVAVSDIAAAVDLAVTHPDAASDCPGVYNVGSARSMTIREMAEAAARVASEVLGRPVPVRAPEASGTPVPPVDFRIGAFRKLGWEPRADLRAELAATVRFAAERLT